MVTTLHANGNDNERDNGKRYCDHRFSTNVWEDRDQGGGEEKVMDKASEWECNNLE